MQTEVLAIEEWTPDQTPAATFEPDVEALADVLRTVVYDGAGAMLTLDTWTGRAAERLYLSLGYVAAGLFRTTRAAR